MSQVETVKRHFKQFGKVYEIVFAVDFEAKSVWLDERSIAPITGRFPLYRSMSSQIYLTVKDQTAQGEWFQISAIRDETLEMVTPRWFGQWLMKTVNLLKAFYFEPLKNHGKKEDKILCSFVQYWDD